MLSSVLIEQVTPGRMDQVQNITPTDQALNIIVRNVGFFFNIKSLLSIITDSDSILHLKVK